MLFKAKELNNFPLGASDGEIGRVKEFYFDDKFWTIRYMVVDTGNWLTGRKVLVSPHAVTDINKDEKIIHTDLTRTQIEESPSWDSDKPISRQFEIEYHGYYGWAGYWYGPYAWGAAYFPRQVTEKEVERMSQEEKGDPNLRSSNEVSGYTIQAENGEMGHVEDFIIDSETWTVRYLVVDTRNWWPGKEVLVSPRWIRQISWNERNVFVGVTRESIKGAPEYDKDSPVTPDYEERLHRHYKREGYWISERLDKKSTNPD
jgi:uncharacterized protein YrrD